MIYEKPESPFKRLTKSKITQILWSRTYVFLFVLLIPVHALLALILAWRIIPGTVIHIGELRHIHSYFVDELKKTGIQASYLAVGDNPHWDKCDVSLPHISNPLLAVIRDSWVFWKIVAPNEIVHCHCMMGISHYPWDILILKIIGRKIIAHFRGCEARVRNENMSRHPKRNICQDCDYSPAYLCMNRENVRRRWTARHFAESIIVTTPDMKDFWPKAHHLPFFIPPNVPKVQARNSPGELRDKIFKIVHVTNQPGIEGTKEIKQIISRMKAMGYDIDFVHLTNVTHDKVLEEYSSADISIGKMKMGYYANAQVESMAIGVPTITWVRPDLLLPGMSEGGFIFCDLDDLEQTLVKLVENPGELEDKRTNAAEVISGLHDSSKIISSLKTIYGWSDHDGQDK